MSEVARDILTSHQKYARESNPVPTAAPSVSPAPSTDEYAGQVSAVTSTTTSASSSVGIMAAGIISELA
eukprot:CAMPEP_0172435856 /NCGR_PEP_ID=MMETSP1064-20121228/71415_1 /TAXON_ID=202472 /ORGANISM="Aulacoseira subarctica , Strain CCAP 1002/5" /LENGTH=68 /DNA_ID=CAMNT_0013184221 /DNA_START=450 /DNA_END=656 /DNA_ORIENTATION=-